MTEPMNLVSMIHPTELNLSFFQLSFKFCTSLAALPYSLPFVYFFPYFFGRNDAKAETPVLWPPHAKSWLIGKDSDAGRDWRQEEKGTTEDEMAGWHHWLDGCESEWTLGDVVGQGGLASAIHGIAKSRTRLSDWTELNWRLGNENKFVAISLL